jgi:rhodanese-related sulfurtransferase
MFFLEEKGFPMNTTYEITRAELQAWIETQKRFVLGEALDLAYYESGHLPGAIPMPLAKVADVAARRIRDKHTDIVVYCASVTCNNSEIAAQKLTKLGYTSVRVYRGGKSDWKDAGLPLEAGVDRSETVPAAVP